MGAFTLSSMIANGWPVLSILLIMSILSCTVIVDRIIALRRTMMGNRAAFVSNVLDILARQGPERAIEFCRRDARPLSRVLGKIVERREAGRETLEKVARYALQSEINDLESYVPILGTIASTAPFVGLFGTVIGIIKAFHSIASDASGGMQVVAIGIAEALITTAFGLFVAIPATMSYNYFVRYIQKVAQDVDLAGFTVVEKISDGVKPQA
ncbi:MAG: MotA/TolQ/ExbB proton channel family protein [bacterium]